MKTDLQALSRLLLPVDSLEAFNRAIPLVGVLIRTMQIEAKCIDLLHVVAGSFLRDYMKSIDFAAGEVPSQEDIQHLRKRYIDDVVIPLINHAGELLSRETAGLVPGVLMEDGDPVKTISSVCQSGSYSTLVMSRRNLAERSEKLTGSVVAGVLHRHAEATIYLVGDAPTPEGISVFSRSLIGVDGSPASKNAVKEAGILLSKVNREVEKILLVHVLDQSCYYDEDGVSCIQAGTIGQQALEEAGNLLVAAGVDPAKITTVIHFGKPGTILAEEAVDCDATLIFIGRRDRSRMAQVFLGSVCTDMIQNCQERTIILTS
jgi:nucleotide-binding universal stress UspA family protein